MGGFSSQVQQAQASQPAPSSGKGGIGNAISQTFAPQTKAYKTDEVGRPIDIQMDGGFAGGVDTPEMYASSPFRQSNAQYAPPDGTMGGKGASTNSATSGQPRMGQPNNYANTIPQWDNASQQLAPAKRSGKGKGG
tara:strand:+ start:1532 stop:1939 length:408 start_codon:yes stop_codon:yes gene_type:complete